MGLFCGFLEPMEIFGSDYAIHQKENPHIFHPDLVDPTTILHKPDEVRGFIVDAIKRAYDRGIRVFTPNTSRLHHTHSLDETSHAKILDAHLSAVQYAFDSTIPAGEVPPEIFLWAATYLPQNESTNEDFVDRNKKLGRFHQEQAKVAKRRNKPLYFGTISSAEEAIQAAIVAKNEGVEDVTIGFKVDHDGNLADEHVDILSSARLILGIMDGKVGFGFDHSSLEGALLAYTFLLLDNPAVSVKALFPYKDGSNQEKLIEAKKLIKAQWAGWL